MRFEQQKGMRFHSQFLWIIVRGAGLWWSEERHKWINSADRENGESLSTACRCRSLRAFRRHLRKHPEINGKAVLVSKFINCDIYT